jgi:hypothetical protein
MKFYCIEKWMNIGDLDEAYKLYNDCCNDDEIVMKREDFFINKYWKQNNEMEKFGFVDCAFYPSGVPDCLSFIMPKSKLAQMLFKMDIMNEEEYKSDTLSKLNKLGIEVKPHNRDWNHECNQNSDKIDLLLCYYADTNFEIYNKNGISIPQLYVKKDLSGEKITKISQGIKHTILQNEITKCLHNLVDEGILPANKQYLNKISREVNAIFAPELYDNKDSNLIMWILREILNDNELSPLFFQLVNTLDDNFTEVISSLDDSLQSSIEIFRRRKRKKIPKDAYLLSDTEGIKKMLSDYVDLVLKIVNTLNKLPPQKTEDILLRMGYHKGMPYIGLTKEQSFYFPQKTREALESKVQISTSDDINTQEQQKYQTENIFSISDN